MIMQELGAGFAFLARHTGHAAAFHLLVEAIIRHFACARRDAHVLTRKIYI